MKKGAMMTKEEYDRSMKLKDQSEKLFRDKCDDTDYTYMYIDQEKMTYSSKIWKDMTKRPDYILSVPHIGSIFVDVKAYSENLFYKDYFDSINKSPPKSFTFQFEELKKYQRLQSETSMKVWFAVASVQKDTVTNEMHFIPVDRVMNFISPEHYGKWKFIQVSNPPCFTDCSKLAYNICARCDKKYCSNIIDIVTLDTKAHFKK
jgi:hypothetical protein